MAQGWIQVDNHEIQMVIQIVPVDAIGHQHQTYLHLTIIIIVTVVEETVTA